MRMKINRLLLAVAAVMSSVLSTRANFTVSLELQGGECSDQLTLICRHSETGIAPLWIHNKTVESGSAIGNAFPGAMYTVLTRTKHTINITGVDSVRALDGYVIQCAYDDLDNLTKSNAVKYSFFPSDFQPKLKEPVVVQSFSERFCTLIYELEGYAEGIAKYPNCADQFSVNFTVTPNADISSIFTDAVAQYNITNLERCKVYNISAEFYRGDQVLGTVYAIDSVMTSPGRINITDVSIGADRNLIKVTYMENEPDCPGYPTERFTVDVDGVQVADLTADAVQSLAIKHANGSVTLSLPLSQPLPENATTLNMTKYNTVPTNRSDDTGNIVTEMETWGTSAVFDRLNSTTDGESQAVVNNGVVIGASVSVGITVIIAGGGGVIVIIIVVIARRDKKKKESEQEPTVNPHQELPGYATTQS